MSPTNHYAHIDYRKVIAWPKRLAREWAFLERPFGALPSRRLLDLGCGTGEHARFFASHGFEVVGACPHPNTDPISVGRAAFFVRMVAIRAIPPLL